MKNIVKSIILCALALFMVLGQTVIGFADPVSEDIAVAKTKMAHNIYTSPDVSGTSGKYNTFTIDFYGVQTPNYTYWALANFSMVLTPQTKVKYRNIDGGGAYTGLQHTRQDTKVAILSFWEYFYYEGGAKKSLRATRIFPEGTSNFGGEGEGTNCIKEYKWDGEKWYRMVLHCWEDIENKTTFVGQWLCDLETGEWFLNAYFDTHLIKSNLKGDMGLFQENYISGINNWTKEREFRVKNLYVNDAKDGEWKSLTKSRLSFGSGQENKMGAASFGVGSDADGEYFWGKAGGLVSGQGEGTYVSAQQAYLNGLTSAQKASNYSIKQPDAPTFGKPIIDSVNLTENNDVWKVDWALGSTSTPQGQYKVEIVDETGKTVFEKTATRPEEASLVLNDVKTDAFKCVLTVTDIFGESVVMEKATEGYASQGGNDTPAPETTVAPDTSETVQPDETSKPTAPVTEDDQEDTSNDSTLIIVGVVLAVVVVGGGVVALVVVSKKKKN